MVNHRTTAMHALYCTALPCTAQCTALWTTLCKVLHIALCTALHIAAMHTVQFSEHNVHCPPLHTAMYTSHCTTRYIALNKAYCSVHFTALHIALHCTLHCHSALLCTAQCERFYKNSLTMFLRNPKKH